MKRKKLSPFAYILGFFMCIIFSPVLIGYGIYLLFCLFKERPIYQKTLFYENTKRKYSHRLYKSDEYSLLNELYKTNDTYMLKKENKWFDYIEGNDKVFFFGQQLYFDVENGNLLVSFDGEPSIPLDVFLGQRIIDTSKKKFIILFKEIIHTLKYDPIDISSFDNLIIGDSIEDIAKKIIEAEKN